MPLLGVRLSVCLSVLPGRAGVRGGCVCGNREGGRGRGELKKQHS